MQDIKVNETMTRDRIAIDEGPQNAKGHQIAEGHRREKDRPSVEGHRREKDPQNERSHRTERDHQIEETVKVLKSAGVSMTQKEIEMMIEEAAVEVETVVTDESVMIEENEAIQENDQRTTIEVVVAVLNKKDSTIEARMKQITNGESEMLRRRTMRSRKWRKKSPISGCQESSPRKQINSMA